MRHTFTIHLVIIIMFMACTEETGEEPMPAPDAAGDADTGSTEDTMPTEDMTSHEDTAPTEDMTSHEDTAPTEDMTSHEDTAPTEDMTSAEDMTSHEDMVSTEDMTSTEDMASTEDVASPEDLASADGDTMLEDGTVTDGDSTLAEDTESAECTEGEDPRGSGGWHILPDSPVAPYYHHDDLFFINEDIGWLCNISGQIWKTEDGGDSWTLLLDQPETSFRSLTFIDEMTGWVANIGPGGWPASGTGGISDPNVIYSTTDGGITWTPETNITGPMPDGICGLDSVGTDTIYGAGRYAGDSYFISSRDGGETWVSQDMNTDYNALVDVLFFTEDEGYVTASNSSGQAALIYTDDGGASWTTVITNDAYHYWKMGFEEEWDTTPPSDAFGYGVTWSGSEGNKWIQTYDGGETWTSMPYASDFEGNGIGFLNQELGWIGGHELYSYQTVNGGESWESFRIDWVYGDYINKFTKVSDTVIYGVGMRVYKYDLDDIVCAGDSDPSVGASGDSGDGFDNSLCELSLNTSGGITDLTYTVPEDDHVQITIHDRGGLIHDRPIDEFHLAGTYTIELTVEDGTFALYAAIVTGPYRQNIRISE